MIPCRQAQHFRLTVCLAIVCFAGCSPNEAGLPPVQDQYRAQSRAPADEHHNPAPVPMRNRPLFAPAHGAAPPAPAPAPDSPMPGDTPAPPAGPNDPGDVAGLPTPRQPSPADSPQSWPGFPQATQRPRAPIPQAESGAAQIPAKVFRVLETIDRDGRPPAGYVGGREFHNSARQGEQPLRRFDAQGTPLRYREWDVNPQVPGVNRGAERLITGSDGSAYFTQDHYRTFIKIR